MSSSHKGGKRGGRRKEKDVLDQLEEFFDGKVRPKVRDGYREVEKFLKKEIRFPKNKKKLLEYDPDSPFSYVMAFLRDKAVASVAPSTKYVIKKVLKAMDPARARVLVEYGPAEGVITRHILSKMNRDGILVAIERNEHFVRALHRMKDSRLRVVHGDVQDIEKILRELDLPAADVIVSGIPFSYFDKDSRRRLVRKTFAMLNPGGRFVPYQFTTHLIPLLKKHFRKVDTQFEVRNLPPFFIFTAHK